MSARNANNPVPYRKPRADLYTVLLIVALVAIGVSCWLLYLEVNPKDYTDTPPWTGGPSARLELDRPAVDGSAASFPIREFGWSRASGCFHTPTLG